LRGDGGGTGRAVASSLARAGAHVAAIDRDEPASRRCARSARHPKQRRQPRHGHHADEPVLLRYARVTERRTAVVPVRRIGMPQDIADVILFLASDRSSYVNGDQITVDGGYVNMLMNLVPRPGFELKGGPSMSGKGKADEGSRVLFDFRF
jgi:NAD(P)-dependent dehydrogenase (short-subunit alcohol dehydrogenase family)